MTEPRGTRQTYYMLNNLSPRDQQGEPIHVAYAADTNYGLCTGVSMSSIIRTNLLSRFHFHLLTDGVRQRDLQRMRKMIVQSGNSLSIYDMKQRFDRGGPLLQHPARLITPMVDELQGTAFISGGSL